MALAHQVQQFFSWKARTRGGDYFRQRRVVIERGDAWGVRAHVRGGEPYQVDLHRDPDFHEVSAWCSCPVAARADLCKHIWAVILAAEAQHLLGGDDRRPVSDVSIDQDALDRLAGLDEDPAWDEDEDDDGTTAPQDASGDAGSLTTRDGREERALGRTPPPTPAGPVWQRRLTTFLPARVPRVAPLVRIGTREILYVLDLSVSGAQGCLTIEIGWRDRRADGEWGRYRTKSWLGPDLAGATTEEDERLLTVLLGRHGMESGLDNFRYVAAVPNYVALVSPLANAILPDLCATGRCRLRATSQDEALAPLAWDTGPPWDLQLDVTRADPESASDAEGTGRRWMVDAVLVRGDERMACSEALMLLANGHLVTPTHIARFAFRGELGWVRMLRVDGPLVVPDADVDALLTDLAERPGTPHLSASDALGIRTIRETPRPRLSVRSAGPGARAKDALHADVVFDYGGHEIVWNEPAERRFLPGPPRILIERDPLAERHALHQVADVGLRPFQAIGEPRPIWALKARQLPEAVRTLLAQGWTVDAEGRRHRLSTATRARVRSGVDWFDLEGVVEFGDASASIGAVIAALARGETIVTLSDGSHGLLPEDWLAQQGHWAALAERRGEVVRFTRGQAAVLDAWLEAAPAIDVDAPFERAREALQAFTGISPADPSEAFTGALRGYQREGLGWLRFLESFGFGGCLADDMGLGKTVQVLAALAGRRASGLAVRPSLVVVPRSLVFNWLREAARFAPGLRLLDYTGADRAQDAAALDAALEGADLVVTTYGTVRRDAERLTHVEFDYVILDEAHAIKNVDSQTTKAVRLVRGRHRLALTGTPVQNHIGELWSLFEFLNPGMLGRSAAFARAMNGNGSGADGVARQALTRVLRPFILRRTKADAAPDLPARVEDTIVCRLDPVERQLYDQLKAHYRQALGARIERDGWGKAKIHVLEALLRLRQAACHPGLIDRSHAGASSAKLDVLLSHLRELREEGHKAIVFSQFVQLLDLVRPALDREGLAYAYLDGRTRDRDAPVDRFQSDPDCPLFLVSLKAGGQGLNLTAAEYVFLLDPWWNPAIEAQAIDRAHRIGQTRAVFAYRLIAEDTIEQKILALQASKRQLAEAILGDDAGALQQLTREDLEELLA